MNKDKAKEIVEAELAGWIDKQGHERTMLERVASRIEEVLTADIEAKERDAFEAGYDSALMAQVIPSATEAYEKYLTTKE